MEKKMQNISENDVVVDLQTFRFRDVYINHLKNIGKPIPTDDYFLIMSTYFLIFYLLWISLKKAGLLIRLKMKDSKTDERGLEELNTEKLRFKEDQQNAMLVEGSKSPVLVYRYDFDNAQKGLTNRLQEIQAMMKEEVLPVPQTGTK